MLSVDSSGDKESILDFLLVYHATEISPDEKYKRVIGKNYVRNS